VVVQVIAAVREVDIDVVIVVPIVGPIFRPGVNHSEPIAAVLEAGIAANQHHGVAVNAEGMPRTEVAVVAIIGNVVAVVATALLPVAMLRLPVVCAMLLPGAALFAFLAVLLLRGLHFDRLEMGLLVGVLLLLLNIGLLL